MRKILSAFALFTMLFALGCAGSNEIVKNDDTLDCNCPDFVMTPDSDEQGVLSAVGTSDILDGVALETLRDLAADQATGKIIRQIEQQARTLDKLANTMMKRMSESNSASESTIFLKGFEFYGEEIIHNLKYKEWGVCSCAGHDILYYRVELEKNDLSQTLNKIIDENLNIFTEQEKEIIWADANKIFNLMDEKSEQRQNPRN